MTKNRYLKELKLLSDFVLRKLEKLFYVLSNKIRIEIIYLLLENGKLTAGEISDKLGIPQNTLSSHLKILYEGSYIDRDKKWRKKYFYIKEDKLKKILQTGTTILFDKWENNWEKIADGKKKIEMIMSNNKGGNKDE